MVSLPYRTFQSFQQPQNVMPRRSRDSSASIFSPSQIKNASSALKWACMYLYMHIHLHSQHRESLCVRPMCSLRDSVEADGGSVDRQVRRISHHSLCFLVPSSLMAKSMESEEKRQPCWQLGWTWHDCVFCSKLRKGGQGARRQSIRQGKKHFTRVSICAEGSHQHSEVLAMTSDWYPRSVSAPLLPETCRKCRRLWGWGRGLRWGRSSRVQPWEFLGVELRLKRRKHTEKMMYISRGWAKCEARCRKEVLS